MIRMMVRLVAKRLRLWLVIKRGLRVKLSKGTAGGWKPYKNRAILARFPRASSSRRRPSQKQKEADGAARLIVFSLKSSGSELRIESAARFWAPMARPQTPYRSLLGTIGQCRPIDSYRIDFWLCQELEWPQDAPHPGCPESRKVHLKSTWPPFVLAASDESRRHETRRLRLQCHTDHRCRRKLDPLKEGRRY